jgi:hypothetical protein
MFMREHDTINLLPKKQENRRTTQVAANPAEEAGNHLANDEVAAALAP